MSVTIAPLTMKPPRLDGLSQRLLDSHYENNYGGAVRRLNAIDDLLADVDWDRAPVFEINGLKREQAMATGSVILHEIYFDSLGGAGGEPDDAALAAAIARDFGSANRWRAEFTAMGKALAGGAGWVVLAWSDRLGRLVNTWAADHMQALAGGVPVLALDMYEHAYHMDFGADAGAYVETFMRNIDWAYVAARFAQARQAGALPAKPAAHEISVDVLHARLAEGAGAPLVIDVRQPADRVRDGLPGTPWHEMDKIDDWADNLPKDTPVVVYCVYGGWVSQDTAAALRQRGIDARVLAGGIAAWRGMGYPTAALS